MQAFVILLAIVLLWGGCKEDVTRPAVKSEPYLLSEKNADSISIELLGYDSVRIRHQSGSSMLRSRVFWRVGVGPSDSAGYREVRLSESNYDPGTGLFSFAFDFSLILPSTHRESRLILRYYRNASEWLDVERIVEQYRYPYPSAEIFMTDSIMLSRPGYFQDIARLGNKFYFHPIGPEGLYEYDLVNRRTRYVYPYLSGDHIAADSIYVFCDVSHSTVQRFNTITDTVDRTIMQPPNFSINILGLEAKDGILSVLVDTRGAGNRMYRYAYDGRLMDSSAVSWRVYHMTVNGGILYGGSFSGSLLRVDLTTLSPVGSVQAPARNMEGIRVLDDRLYYCNYEKRMIGSVPLRDLR